MARAPTKTCPKLHRILTEAPLELLARFLAAKAFEKLAWLSAYRIDPAAPNARDQAARMLAVEPKAKLLSLENVP